MNQVQTEQVQPEQIQPEQVQPEQVQPEQAVTPTSEYVSKFYQASSAGFDSTEIENAYLATGGNPDSLANIKKYNSSLQSIRARGVSNDFLSQNQDKINQAIDAGFSAQSISTSLENAYLSQNAPQVLNSETRYAEIQHSNEVLDTVRNSPDDLDSIQDIIAKLQTRHSITTSHATDLQHFLGLSEEASENYNTAHTESILKIINSFQEKYNVPLSYDYKTNDFFVEVDGQKHEVTPGFFDTLYENKAEIASVLGGSVVAAAASPGILAGAGLVTAAGVAGSAVDYMFSLDKLSEFDAESALYKSVNALELGFISEALTVALKPLARLLNFGAKKAGGAVELSTSSSKAVESAKTTLGISSDEAEKIAVARAEFLGLEKTKNFTDAERAVLVADTNSSFVGFAEEVTKKHPDKVSLRQVDIADSHNKAFKNVFHKADPKFLDTYLDIFQKEQIKVKNNYANFKSNAMSKMAGVKIKAPTNSLAKALKSIPQDAFEEGTISKISRKLNTPLKKRQRKTNTKNSKKQQHKQRFELTPDDLWGLYKESNRIMYSRPPGSEGYIYKKSAEKLKTEVMDLLNSTAELNNMHGFADGFKKMNKEYSNMLDLSRSEVPKAIFDIDINGKVLGFKTSVNGAPFSSKQITSIISKAYDTHGDALTGIKFLKNSDRKVFETSLLKSIVEDKHSVITQKGQKIFDFRGAYTDDIAGKKFSKLVEKEIEVIRALGEITQNDAYFSRSLDKLKAGSDPTKKNLSTSPEGFVKRMLSTKQMGMFYSTFSGSPNAKKMALLKHMLRFSENPMKKQSYNATIKALKESDESLDFVANATNFLDDFMQASIRGENKYINATVSTTKGISKVVKSVPFHRVIRAANIPTLLGYPYVRDPHLDKTKQTIDKATKEFLKKQGYLAVQHDNGNVNTL